jgi:hypothetical protein
MNTMSRYVWMVAIMLWGTSILYGQTYFVAHLTGSQENPAVDTDASGTGYFVLTDGGLAYRITVEGLEITAAHFHRETIGRNGGVVRNLAFNGSKTASGTWSPTDDSQPLTDELIGDLFAGRLYVNVHTSENPGGEIRGQVLLASGTGLIASIDGGQETDEVQTDAAGTGSFTLTDAGLVFTMTVEGVDFTAAHFHNASAGVNGPVVRTLTGDFDENNSATGIWRSTDDEPLTEELIAELLDGNIYVNFHSPTYPAGEIRGQLLYGSGTYFVAHLTGSQENPAVDTDASGTGYFVLTDGGLAYRITVEGLEITAAHFHRETIGRNGGVVRNLAFNGSKTASGTWSPTDDSQPLTDELIGDLFAGRLYVNVHTSENPGGEIRGQVLLASGTGLIASIDGGQETDEVQTDAAGTGSFTLTDAGLVFTMTVEGVDFTAAHFHNASAGVNGPVVRTLTGDFDENNSATGIWRSTDDEPLTEELIAELLDGNIYVNFHSPTYPAGEIRGQLGDGTITSIRELPGGPPQSYRLFQNFPNPFNPTTVILFELSEREIVSLKIFDILGREVATLIDNEELPAGGYTVEFNPGNLSSGSYFYTLTTEAFTQTRRMIYIR